jgi:hypothetical protein
MERNAEIKFARELKSFYSLTFISLVFGAIAMGLSVALGVTNILTFINQWSPVSLIPACIGFLAFPFTIKWLLSGVEIMDGVNEIKDEYSKVKKGANGEALTTLIVRTMAQYRAKKSTISKLILLCKVAAICFIINGIFVLIQLALNMPADGLLLATSLVVALINLGIGAVGLYIPRSFQKYSSCWEVRIQGSALAEKELSSLMEGK